MTVSFKELSPSKTKSFTKRLLKIDENTPFDNEKTKVFTRSLSFSEGWLQVDCENHGNFPHQKQTFFANDDQIIPLVYTPDPQKNIFSPLSLHLNEENVFDYLLLYFKTLLKNGERLIPASHTDDIEWQDDLSPMLRKSLDQEFHHYPKIKKDKNNIQAVFLCVFQQSLMELTCKIDDKGKVDIVNRKILIDDLPTKNFP